ncbi:MAG: PKD domain-containing protein, partial [Actinobacteria bacterium]|nr:PKD domain-containing protein [Actinomycetota bacterium]
MTIDRSSKDEETVDVEEFSGIPNSFLISKLKISGQAIDVDISDNYAYLTNDLGVLYVIDIKDKENPSTVGKCPGINSANIVIVKDDYAYISYTEWISSDDSEAYTVCGFYIVDIKEKEDPKLIGNYNTGENNKKSVYGLFIEGDYAYINTTVENENGEISRLEIVDISRKRNPEIVSATKVEGLPSSIWIKDSLAYININFYDYKKREYIDDSKLLIVDIKDKKNPKIIGSCTVSSNAWSIYVLENYAYISSSKWDKENEKYTGSLLQVVNIDELSSPKAIGSCEIPGGAWEMDLMDGFIYISSLSGGIYAVDVSNSDRPVIVDSLKTSGNSYDITIKSNYGYIADGFEGLAIVELSRSSIEKEKLYIDNDQDINLPPKAFIEVIGDKSSGDYFQIKNPVYFSAGKAFDPDGDDLIYSWIIDNNEYSNEESFYYYFDKPGQYEVKLIVSDGKESSEATDTVLVAEMSLPIAPAARHDFTVEIGYTLINNGPGSLKDIECFMRIPQTYYPFQIINDYTPNISNTEELLDNNWNLLIRFQLENELMEGESLTASAEIDATLYEFNYANIDSSNLTYDKDDEDFLKYTTDDLFVDSDNPEIRNTAKSLIKNETRPIEIAKILYNYVVSNLYYDFPRAEDKDYEFLYASEILERGKGVCADYAILYTALLRSAGIPARLAAGIPVYAILFEEEKEIDVGHAWVEVKLPGYGWIPID